MGKSLVGYKDNKCNESKMSYGIEPENVYTGQCPAPHVSVEVNNWVIASRKKILQVELLRE